MGTEDPESQGERMAERLDNKVAPNESGSQPGFFLKDSARALSRSAFTDSRKRTISGGAGAISMLLSPKLLAQLFIQGDLQSHFFSGADDIPDQGVLLRLATVLDIELHGGLRVGRKGCGPFQ